MKNARSAALGSILAAHLLSVTIAPPAAAQNETSAGPARPTAEAISQIWPNQPVLATELPAGLTAEDLIGRDVHDPEGEDLGRLRDLVVDITNGKVRYAIVGTGGFFGIGEEQRILPIAALSVQGAEGDDPRLTLTQPLTEEAWEQAPTFNEDELQQLGSDETQQRIAAHYDVQEATPAFRDAGGADAATSPAAASPASAQMQEEPQLVLATDLQGKPLKSDGDLPLGSVDAVLVHLAAGDALIRLNPDPTVTGTNDQYILLLSHVSPSAGEDEGLETRFTVADFERARPDYVEGLAPAGAAE